MRTTSGPGVGDAYPPTPGLTDLEVRLVRDADTLLDDALRRPGTWTPPPGLRARVAELDARARVAPTREDAAALVAAVRAVLDLMDDLSEVGAGGATYAPVPQYRLAAVLREALGVTLP